MNLTSKFFMMAALAVLSSVARSQVIASDNAADGAYSGGNVNGLNGGFGFGAWVATPSSNSNTAGNFQYTSSQNGSGMSGDIDSAGKSFGLYANSSQTSTMLRPITVSMAGYRTVTLDFDNGWIDNGSETWVAIGNYTFGFTGGQSTYWYDLGSGRQDTGLNFTDNGLHLTLILNGVGGYYFSANPNYTSTVWATANPFSGAQIPLNITTANVNAGFGASNNSYINNLKIVAPEPGSFIALGIGALAISLKRRKAAR